MTDSGRGTGDEIGKETDDVNCAWGWGMDPIHSLPEFSPTFVVGKAGW